jgi:hypothetical protein
MTKHLLLLCLVACNKTSAGEQPAASAVEKDPACTAKAKALEPWLAALELERQSYELGELPVIDRAPAPVPHEVDWVDVHKFGIYAWDVGEHDHALSKLGNHATQAQLVDYLTKMKAQPAGPDELHPAPDDLLRVQVDGDATWGDVVRVVDAATKAGYAHAVFPFEATSKLEQPPGVDAHTMTEAAAKEASDKLAALKKTCKPLDSVAWRHKPDFKDAAADAAALAKETVAALVECNCAANPDELRALMWKDARWHHARPRVGITLALGDAGTTIALPAKTPWPDALGKLVDAAPAVKLAAK